MRSHTKLSFFIVVTALALGFASWGVKVGETDFPDRVTVKGKTLTLNGAGLRTATFLAVKVYAAALYLVAPATQSAAVLDGPFPRELRMKFLREISASDMTKAWNHSFKENCEKEDCEKLKPPMEKLIGWMADVKEGDEMVYRFFPEGVEYVVNGSSKGTIEAPGFSRLLLSTWIGKEPPTEHLKEKLLGGQ